MAICCITSRQMKVGDPLTNLLMSASILTHLSHFLIVQQSSLKGAFYHTCIQVFILKCNTANAEKMNGGSMRRK